MMTGLPFVAASLAPPAGEARLEDFTPLRVHHSQC
jgi:hypothetical protein